MPSLSHRILHACTWQVFRFVNLERGHIPVLRPRLDFIANALVLPWKVKRKKIKIDHIEAEWLFPGQSAEDHVLLFLHGGGYAVGSPATHRGMAGRLAQTSGMDTLIIDYRLAPEHPFPAALEDAMLVYKWLLSQGKAVVLAGDSAGGGLCMALQLLLQQDSLLLPKACVCFSPWVDLSSVGESRQKFKTKDPIVQPHILQEWADAYAGKTPPNDPLLSPIYGKLGKLAPLLIHASTTEVLTDDAKRLAQVMSEQGGEVKLRLFENLQHVWQLFWLFVPEADESLIEAGSFLRLHCQR